VTIYDQLQRALSAEGINGSIQHVFLSLRMHNDTAHVDVRHAPSESEAREWMQTVGRQFREPVAVGRIEGDNSPVRLPPLTVNESSESIFGIGDEANIWRGYGGNTRGVIKFRQGRYVAEVNAPSVEDATVVAKGLASLLNP
jgi:hypothetical protein